MTSNLNRLRSPIYVWRPEAAFSIAISFEIIRCGCDNPGLQMTKTELQSALAEATQTNKRTAGVFLDTLSNLAYKETKKNGEFVLPGFGKLVKQKRKARTGFTQDATEDQDSSQDRRQIPGRQGGKGRGSGGKEVVSACSPRSYKSCQVSTTAKWR